MLHPDAARTTPAAPGPSLQELRWIVDAYEQAQLTRIQTGERIRALLRMHDAGDGASATPEEEVAARLVAIRDGAEEGPYPLLGRSYRRHWEGERDLARAMEVALRDHPAWPWLARVRGVGPTLAAKLLARLDVRRAETPSAFWSFCGLATVPGVELRCEVCGYRATLPESRRVVGEHRRPGTAEACDGTLARVRGPEDGVRVAQPRPTRGVRSPFDQHARKACYQIGASFLSSGGPYEEFCRREREKLVVERPGWSASRCHLAALRKTEKLFLAHLWLVWREAEGLPLTRPYAALQEHEVIDPWTMVEAEAPSAPVRAPHSLRGPAPAPQRPRRLRRAAPSPRSGH